AVCTKKYGAEFCTKLKNSCFEILKVKATDGPLPVSISICISSENWLAQCYAKYGSKRCSEWREICRDRYSKTSDLTESEKECVKSHNAVILCRAKHGNVFCEKLAASCSMVLRLPAPRLRAHFIFSMPAKLSD
ncbi:unnamed protein product, partial [Anisakis simplex]|uniref:GDNF domain-containing protein n=1 Tax=Anisakis simplex TaxID=6269 RepID=A0A0M3KGD2_ANISI